MKKKKGKKGKEAVHTYGFQETPNRQGDHVTPGAKLDAENQLGHKANRSQREREGIPAKRGNIAVDGGRDGTGILGAEVIIAVMLRHRGFLSWGEFFLSALFSSSSVDI